jgi:splicing factor 1
MPFDLICDHDLTYIYIVYRSPSPEPIYNNEGKRLNTREYRTRKKLEEDRHKLVLRAQELNAEYKPPADYKYVKSFNMSQTY